MVNGDGGGLQPYSWAEGPLSQGKDRSSRWLLLAGDVEFQRQQQFLDVRFGVELDGKSFLLPDGLLVRVLQPKADGNLVTARQLALRHLQVEDPADFPAVVQAPGKQVVDGNAGGGTAPR